MWSPPLSEKHKFKTDTENMISAAIYMPSTQQGAMGSLSSYELLAFHSITICKIGYMPLAVPVFIYLSFQRVGQGRGMFSLCYFYITKCMYTFMKAIACPRSHQLHTQNACKLGFFNRLGPVSIATVCPLPCMPPLATQPPWPLHAPPAMHAPAMHAPPATYAPLAMHAPPWTESQTPVKI